MLQALNPRLAGLGEDRGNVREGLLQLLDCDNGFFSLVDGDVHWGAVLGVEGEHPGAGGGAGFLRKPRGLPLQ